MFSIEDAILIATKAHKNQMDKGNKPYIYHPLRVMLSVDTEGERIVAVLHDVIEDTDLSLRDLIDEGLPPELNAALDCLTKRKGESYMEFIYRVATNPIAKKVKIADLKDNSEISRIQYPTGTDFQRVEKYNKALEILTNN